ncbi:hypothetical protein BJX99DRAFT_259343 [Aspergillus californicus]
MYETYYALLLVLAGAIGRTYASPVLGKGGARGETDAATHFQQPTLTISETVTQCDAIAQPSEDVVTVFETRYVTEHAVVTVTATAVITAEVCEATHAFTTGQDVPETAPSSPVGSTAPSIPPAQSGSTEEPTNGSAEVTTPGPGHSGVSTEYSSGSPPGPSDEPPVGTLTASGSGSATESTSWPTATDQTEGLIHRRAYYILIYDILDQWSYNIPGDQFHHWVPHNKAYNHPFNVAFYQFDYRSYCYFHNNGLANRRLYELADKFYNHL